MAKNLCAVIHKDCLNAFDRSKYVEMVSISRGIELTKNGHYIYVTQIQVHGITNSGIDLAAKDDIYYGQNGGLDDLLEAYSGDHPEAVRIIIDIALPDKQYLAGKS